MRHLLTILTLGIILSLAACGGEEAPPTSSALKAVPTTTILEEAAASQPTLEPQPEATAVPELLPNQLRNRQRCRQPRKWP